MHFFIFHYNETDNKWTSVDNSELCKQNSDVLHDSWNPYEFSYCTAEDDIFEVYAEVISIAGAWEKIAIGLKVPPTKVSCIAKEKPNDPEMCLYSLLHEWIKKTYNVQKYGHPSWQFLVKAVASSLGGNNPALAETIAKEHQGA